MSDLDEFDEGDFNFDDIYEDFGSEDLNSGIRGLDMSYVFDKRVEKLVEPINKAMAYIKEHTDLSEEEILERVNDNIFRVELVDDYEDNPIGVGYVDGIFKMLSLRADELERDPETIYRFILHEMTHMMGNRFQKKLFKKNPILVSGYSRENIFDENPTKTNVSFNEAAVEMFIEQGHEYRQEMVFGEIPINTNQDFNEGLYCVNSNIIHQMLLASGMDEQEFYEGLYDYNASKRNIRKFPRKVFKQLSSNMDDTTQALNDYFDADFEIYLAEKEGKEIDPEKEKKKMADGKASFIAKVSENERLIIDKILKPRLSRIPIDDRQAFLDNYYQFMICEQEYFRQATGYKAVEPVKKEANPIFTHYDVDVSKATSMQQTASKEDNVQEQEFDE